MEKCTKENDSKQYNTEGMEVVDSVDFLPYDHKGEDYVVTSYGDIVFAAEIRMIEAFTLGEDSGDENKSSKVRMIYHTWKLALNGLPDDTVIQKYNFVQTSKYKEELSDTDGLTRQWNEKYYSDRDIVTDKGFIVVTFKGPKSLDNVRKAKLKDRIGRFTDIDFHVRESRDRFVEFYKLLSSEFSLRPLLGNDIIDLFIDSWNCELGSSESEILRDIEVFPSGLSVGKDFISVLTSRKKVDIVNGFTGNPRGIVPSSDFENNTQYYKDNFLPCSYLFPIGLGSPIDHLLIETIMLCSRETVEKELKSERLWLNPLKGMLKSRDAMGKQNKIDDFIEIRAENGYRYAKWSANVLVKGISEEKSKSAAQKISEVSKKMLGLYMEFENFATWPNFYYSMPGLGKKTTNLRLDYLETISYLTHLESMKKGNPEGVVMVDQFGKPFKQAFWKTKDLEAMNAVVFGPTGRGKSVAVNVFLDHCIDNGDVVIIVDEGRSYKRLVEMKGGVFIDSAIQSSISFNPFMDCYKDESGKYYPNLDDKGEPDPKYLNYAVSLILTSWYKSAIPAKEVPEILKEFIKRYFSDFNIGKIDRLCFDSFYEFVLTMNRDDFKFFDFDSFTLVLKAYTTMGEYGYLFNNTTNVDIDNKVICFEMKHILKNADILTQVMLIINNLFQKKLSEYGGIVPVRFWIDESKDFLKHPMMAESIGDSYRKVRKEGGQVAIMMQSIDYLDEVAHQTKGYVLANADIRILLSHAGKENLFDTYQKELTLSDDEMNLLRNQSSADPSKYRMIFIKYGNAPGYLARVEISEESKAVYQTDRDKGRIVDKLIEESGSYKEGIEKYVKEYVKK